MEEYSVNGIDTQGAVVTLDREQWNPPARDRLKLNTDVAMDLNNALMGFGWIIRDEDGHFIAAKGRSCAGSFSVKEAEAVSKHPRGP